MFDMVFAVAAEIGRTARLMVSNAAMSRRVTRIAYS